MANIAKIFVIIVTYKGHQWYERCFKSLRNSEYPVQTIVIDNASNDGTVEYIREHFPEIHLIESKENLGFGRANNIGMRYALDHGCNYVFLLNQDAWIEPNTLKKLVDVHNSFPEYGILSPMHLAADKKHIESGLLSYLANCKITDPTFLQDLYFNSLKEVYTSNYINAAGWFLPKSTLNTIGGFDPIFYHYEEDDDYLNRVLYHGLQVGVVPSARMVHDHREGTSALSSEQLTVRRQQYLLVRFTNLNKQDSWVKYQCYQLRKVIGCFVRGHWRQMQIWWQDFRFLCRMKERINFSKNQNKLKQSTWL